MGTEPPKNALEAEKRFTEEQKSLSEFEKGRLKRIDNVNLKKNIDFGDKNILSWEQNVWAKIGFIIHFESQLVVEKIWGTTQSINRLGQP